MADIKAEDVKKLREKTGVGMMDCKKALEEAGGDFEKAIDFLKTKGLAKAEKRKGRSTSEGRIGIYLHRPGEQIGVMVEINCETDFVARTEDFASFARDIAMHVAASNPLYLTREDIPEDVRQREMNVFKTQAQESGKPEKIWDKISEGKMEKLYAEWCLMEQRFIKDNDKTIKDFLSDMIAKTGENIIIRRFARFQVGENLD